MPPPIPEPLLVMKDDPIDERWVACEGHGKRLFVAGWGREVRASNSIW